MNFKPGQLVLRYNGKNEIKPGKFKVRWLGPYIVMEVKDNGAIKLSTLDNNPLKNPVNGSKLRLYNQQNQIYPICHLDIIKEIKEKVKNEGEEIIKQNPNNQECYKRPRCALIKQIAFHEEKSNCTSIAAVAVQKVVR